MSVGVRNDCKLAFSSERCVSRRFSWDKPAIYATAASGVPDGAWCAQVAALALRTRDDPAARQVVATPSACHHLGLPALEGPFVGAPCPAHAAFAGMRCAECRDQWPSAQGDATPLMVQVGVDETCRRGTIFMHNTGAAKMASVADELVD